MDVLSPPMSGMQMVLERLRNATVAEQGTIAKALEYDLVNEAEALGVKPNDDPQSSAVLVAKAFKEVAKTVGYRDTLVAVAKEAASLARWDEPKIKDETSASCIEDYIYEALSFFHIPNRDSLAIEEKKRLQSKAVAALNGQAYTAREETAAWAHHIGVVIGMGLGWNLGLWLVAPVGVLALVGWLMSPSMKKLVPATLILVHIRKRQEFEAVLREGAVAT